MARTRAILITCGTLCVSGCGILLAAQEDPPVGTPPTSGDQDGTSNDGTGPDGPGTGDAAAACPSRFCSDFDPPRDVYPFGWTASSAPTPGIRLTGDASTTPPNAIEVASPPLTPTFLAFSVPNATLEARWELDYRVIAAGTDEDLWLLDVVCSTRDGIQDDVRVKMKKGATGFKVQTNSDTGADVEFFAPAGFVTITLELDIGTARLSANGVTAAASVAVSNCLATSDHLISIGVVDKNASPWVVQIDRVRGDWL